MATIKRNTLAATPLGKELRKIRVDHEIPRAQMAKDLKITDRELARIEEGKADVSDDFLQDVAARYSDNSLHAASIATTLRDALIKSVASVSFDLTGMSFSQREKVIALRDEIAQENAAAMAAAAAEKKRQAEAKRAERKARPTQAKPVIEEPKPIPAKVESADDSADDLLAGLDDLTDDELDILAA